jgi:hypothetical protein
LKISIGIDILYVVGIALWSSPLPYLIKDLVPVAHDTIFHMSRIEQLSISISEGNWFPAIYPYENVGYGYASPFFYSDVFLIPAALLHLGRCSAQCLFQIHLTIRSHLLVSTVSPCIIVLIISVSKRQHHRLCDHAGYMFANYHISDLYVRNALGEIFALMFLPLILEGMYRILWNDEKKWGCLALGLSGLAISHDLTFVLGVVFCIVLFLIKIKSLTKEKFFMLCKGILAAFLLTSFFTLPMLEQLRSQQFNLSNATNLGVNSMAFWQYFANRTIFGFSSNELGPNEAMTVNVGWFLTFAPLLYIFFDHKKKEHPFVTVCVIIGYIMMLLPAKIVPWNSLTFLDVIQFPWRLNTISIVCLALPAAYGVLSICRKRIWIIGLQVCLVLEALIHVRPELLLKIGFTSSTTWQDVKEGAVLDPWYGSPYFFVELAGADYLPASSPNFHTYPQDIKDENGTSLTISYTQKSTTLTFDSNNTTAQAYILPLSYYKGYQVYQVVDGKEVKVDTYESSNGLVECKNAGSGEYICRYEDTPLRKACMGISLVTLLGLAFIPLFRKRKVKENSAD